METSMPKYVQFASRQGRDRINNARTDILFFVLHVFPGNSLVKIGDWSWRNPIISGQQQQQQQPESHLSLDRLAIATVGGVKNDEKRKKRIRVKGFEVRQINYAIIAWAPKGF